MVTQYFSHGQYQIGFDRAKDADAAERFAKAPSVYVIAPNKSQQLAVKVKPKAVSQPQVSASKPAAATPTPTPSDLPAEMFKDIENSNIRKIIASRLTESKQ